VGKEKRYGSQTPEYRRPLNPNRAAGSVSECVGDLFGREAKLPVSVSPVDPL
jgi:hypothetical protein